MPFIARIKFYVQLNVDTGDVSVFNFVLRWEFQVAGDYRHAVSFVLEACICLLWEAGQKCL